MVRPERIGGDLEQHLVGQHLLHQPAGFHTLAGIVVSGAAVFIAAEHAARDLAITLANLAEIRISRLKVGRRARLQEILSRLAETLGDIHIVPVGQIVLHPPIRGTPVDFLRQLQQIPIPGAVVEPVDTVEIVAAAHLLPVSG